MNFLYVSVMKNTCCKVFFSRLLFQICITGCHCQLSAWQIASVNVFQQVCYFCFPGICFAILYEHTLHLYFSLVQTSLAQVVVESWF